LSQVSLTKTNPLTLQFPDWRSNLKNNSAFDYCSFWCFRSLCFSLLNGVLPMFFRF
jgi:hypothetical protein